MAETEMMIHAYDVASIKSFIFDSQDFKTIVGASQLVKSFDKHVAELVAMVEGTEVVYTGGGTGLFLVRDQSAQEGLIAAIEKASEILLGHRVVQASIEPKEPVLDLPDWFRLDSVKTCGAFARSFSRLAIELNRKKADFPLHEEEIPSDSMCPSCGKRSKVSGSDRCNVCKEKAQKGEAFFRESSEGKDSLKYTFDLQRIATQRSGGKDSENDKMIGVIYGDGNSLGDIYKSFEDYKDYARFSRELESTIASAVRNALQEGQKGEVHTAAPILGGDDLMLLVPQSRVIPVLQTLKRELGNCSFCKTPITFSFGVAILPVTLPLGFIFSISEELLKSAKKERVKAIQQKRPDAKDHFLSFRYLKGHTFEAKKTKTFPHFQASFDRGMSFQELEKILALESRVANSGFSKNIIQKLWRNLEMDPCTAAINLFYFLHRTKGVDDQWSKDFLEGVYMSEHDWKTICPSKKEIQTRIGTFSELYDLCSGKEV